MKQCPSEWQQQMHASSDNYRRYACRAARRIQVLFIVCHQGYSTFCGCCIQKLMSLEGSIIISRSCPCQSVVESSQSAQCSHHARRVVTSLVSFVPLIDALNFELLLCQHEIVVIESSNTISDITSFNSCRPIATVYFVRVTSFSASTARQGGKTGPRNRNCCTPGAKNRLIKHRRQRNTVFIFSFFQCQIPDHFIQQISKTSQYIPKNPW